MQQRYYDPIVGVLLSADPVDALLSPVAQFNRYRYANGNSYRFNDPDGRRAIDSVMPGEASCFLQIRCGAPRFSTPPPRAERPYDKKLAEVQATYPDITTEIADAAYDRISQDNAVSTAPGGNEWGFEIDQGSDGSISVTKSREGDRGNVGFSLRPGVMKALGHTHGRSSDWHNKYFSRNDVAASKALDKPIPIFLGNNAGEFRVFMDGMPRDGKVDHGRLRGAEGELLCSNCIPVHGE